MERFSHNSRRTDQYSGRVGDEATAETACASFICESRGESGTPDDWRSKPSSFFGVVTSRGSGSGGGAYLTLSVRRLEPRNVCENRNDEDTCRVTVSDHDFGTAHAIVSLVPEDDVGEHSLGIGSLVRVVGTFGQDIDATDGAPILRATYYRHWPRYFYVTKASARTMRQ